MIVVLCSRVTGPLEPYALGFAVELTRLGYTSHSATGQVGVVAYLSRWMVSERLVVEDRATGGVLGRRTLFAVHTTAPRNPGRRGARTA